jgi:glyoxylate/hydroxypyruvate reductase A
MTRDAVVIKCGDHLLEAWVSNMTRLLPEFSIYPYSSAEIPNSSVKYVIGWCPDARWINEFPNLRAVISIGSGVDHIVHLDELRPDLDLIRTVSPDLVQRLREFVTLSVLSWHRQFPSILEHNRSREWERFAVSTADTIQVGIMGFGSMGKAAAESLSSLGYDVSVWASSPRSGLPYDYFQGDDQLNRFVARNNVVICLLPLTDATRGILNYELLSQIKPGGCLMNFGRGAHLVDDDLIRAIADGHLSAAYLDGFRVEPIPVDSPFWDVPEIIITFHSAAYISPETGPAIIANNLRRYDAGEQVTPMYSRERGF